MAQARCFFFRRYLARGTTRGPGLRGGRIVLLLANHTAAILAPEFWLRLWKGGYSHAELHSLGAPARAPATHAPIAPSIPRHDAAAEAARWRVTQIHDARQRIGRVHRTRLPASGFRLQVRHSIQIAGL